MDNSRVVSETGRIGPARLFEQGSGWVLAGTFVFATAAGLLIQWFILPVLLPGLHAGHGLQAGGDWIGFHEYGLKLANALSSEGWSAFELRPVGNFPIAESGVLYFLTGVREPWVVVPLDALIYASAVLAVFNVFCRIAGRRAALIGLVPLVLFPGAIQFYSQVEKDVWAFAGSAWLLFVITALMRPTALSWRQCSGLIVVTFMAAGFAWLVRPYFSVVQLGAFACGGIIALSSFCLPGGRPRRAVRLACLLGCAGVIAVFAAGVPAALWPSLKANNASNLLAVHGSTRPNPDCVTQPGELDRLMPAVARRPLQSIASIRADQRAATGYAGSNIDNDACFSRASDVVRYLPRALQIALFAPFPDMWFERGVSIGARAMRAISGLEMLCVYILLPGVALAIWQARGRRRYVFVILAVVVPIVLLLAATIPNIGTLYRMRYGYLQVLAGLGAIGWIELLRLKRVAGLGMLRPAEKEAVG